MLGRSTLLAAVIAALGAFNPGAAPPMPPARHRPASRRAGGIGGSTITPRGPGWSCAQVKRMAKKRRNQLRNKAAHRRSA